METADVLCAAIEMARTTAARGLAFADRRPGGTLRRRFGAAFVANSTNGTVSAIDAATGKGGATVSGGLVEAIDTTTGTPFVAINVGVNPIGVTVTPDDGEVLVANTGTDTVSAIATKLNITTATITVGTGALGSGLYGIAA
jgi:YVTN family beta-propeller protein